MIIFDRLQISDNGKWLYIDVHVNQADYFENIYIDKVIIQTQDQVSESDPCTPGDQCIYQMTADENTKELHLALNTNTDFDITDKTLSNKLLFVYVKCKGTPDPCTPCTLDEEITLGVTFDENLLYQKVMQFTKSLADDCNIPVAFTDFILLWNAFKASMETEHYVPAIKYWNMLFGMDAEGIPYGAYDKNSGVIHKLCGCHG
jgi:hypothetical protein